MTFVVENGEGLPNSNAFISVAYAKMYWSDRGRDLAATYDDAEIQAAIVRATQYLSESFRYKGYPKKPRNATGGQQALEFPRVDLFDQEGYWVDSNSIPPEIMEATAEVMWQELVNPFSMSPTYEYQSRVKSEKIGPIAIEYDVTYKTAESARPVVLLVRDLIGQFLLASFANPLSGQAIRG